MFLDVQEISIGLRNQLAPIWRQAISQSNDDKNLCFVDAACEENELRGPWNINPFSAVFYRLQKLQI